MVMAQKTALESLWKGKCTIYVHDEQKNQTNKRSKFVERAVYTDQPCKLSFETIKQTTENNNATQVMQSVKLFISPDVVIPPGCKITVTQNGKTTDYQSSGEAGVYSYHQEIVLELFKGWA